MLDYRIRSSQKDCASRKEAAEHCGHGEFISQVANNICFYRVKRVRRGKYPGVVERDDRHVGIGQW